MQALVFTAAGRVELRDEPEPSPAPDGTLVHVRASGICGSELHGFRSVGFRVPPLIMGHEFAGVTGDGRRVVVNPLIGCGHCAACERGDPQICSRRELLGIARAGGFAERVTVPEPCLYPLPDDIGWSAAALIEPLANAVHAWSLVPEVHGQVTVLGAGTIGLVCALVGRQHGFDVSLHEPSPVRREIARGLGFTVHEQPKDDAEYGVVFDAVGAPTTRAQSTAQLAAGGTAVWLGLAVDETSLGGNAIVRGERRITGSFAYRPAEFGTAVQMARVLDLSWSTDVPMSEAEKVFYALAEGSSDAVKAVLVPDGTGP